MPMAEAGENLSIITMATARLGTNDGSGLCCKPFGFGTGILHRLNSLINTRFCFSLVQARALGHCCDEETAIFLWDASAAQQVCQHHGALLHKLGIFGGCGGWIRRIDRGVWCGTCGAHQGIVTIGPGIFVGIIGSSRA